MDVDANLKLRANRCLDLFQEVGFAHSEASEASISWLASKDLGWVITSWQVHIEHLPKPGEKISVTTYANPIGRIQAGRRFVAEDEDGKVLFSAKTLWVLMNKTQRKPSRLPKEVFAEYKEDESSTPLTRKDCDEPELRNANLIKTRNFHTTRRDVDSNNHINNVAYLTWAIDDVPDEIYENLLTDMDIRYHTEATPGTEIKACTYTSADTAEDGSKTWEVTTRFLPADANVSEVWPNEEERRAPYFAKVTTFWTENKEEGK